MQEQSNAAATSPHDAEDNVGVLCTGGFGRPTEGSQQGRPDGASDEFFGETEGESRHGTCVKTRVSLVLGVRGCPKPNQPTSPKHFRILVSAAGLEPATH